MSATEARVHFGELLRAVSDEGAQVVVERGGKPAAVVISKEAFDRLTNRPTQDWWEIVLATQRRFADARKRGALPDWTALIREEREKRDAQLTENMLRYKHRDSAADEAVEPSMD
jgi:prevent-host-death family protein